MNRFGALLLGALAASSALQATASAQPTTPTTTTPTAASGTAFTSPLVVKRQDGPDASFEQLKNEPISYGTVANCKETVKYRFSVDSYSAPAPVVEAWLGIGSNDCSTVANRTRVSTTSEKAVCKPLGVVTATSRPTIEVTGLAIFDANNDGNCDASKDQKYVVYIIPLSQVTDIQANQAYEPITIANISTLKATFTTFTTPPSAPSDSSVKGLDGENKLGVEFDVIAGTLAKTRYRVYYDYGTGGGPELAPDAGTATDAATDAAATTDASDVADAGVDADVADADVADADVADADVADADVEVDAAAGTIACGSGNLKGGAAPERPNDPQLYSQSVTSGSSSMSDLDKRGIPLNGTVAVAVVTIDPAGNESVLTTPICVKRVMTKSFLDACQEDPKCRNSFDECSVSAPGLPTGSLLGLSFLLGLGLTMFVRRSNRAGKSSSKFRRHV